MTVEGTRNYVKKLLERYKKLRYRIIQSRDIMEDHSLITFRKNRIN